MKRGIRIGIVALALLGGGGAVRQVPASANACDGDKVCEAEEDIGFYLSCDRAGFSGQACAYMHQLIR
jgi:hypothetical protein